MIFLLIISLFLIFLLGYILFDKLERWLSLKIHKKKIDNKIKEALFNEIGFSYRETFSGKQFLIIDKYQENKAIKL